MNDETQGLRRLPLHDLHVRLGARMVPFAGWEMPVQYPAGVMKEHLHTRAAAGLFDVSHMGQLLLRPKQGMEALALSFERLMPVDVLGLAEGRQRYGMLTNETGGILDDLMFANRGDHLFVVVNAACAPQDTAHLREHLREVAEVATVDSRGLLALQGPAAEAALARLVPDAARMRFMDLIAADWQGTELWISRSGYTGEDGFEISVPKEAITAFAEALLAMEEVAPIGLGARDSLRLEAGLCLYGHDIDTTTSPVEAGLSWAIQKARRPGGLREGGFAGAQRILEELADAPERLRVGLRPEGRAPMREGTELFTPDGTPVGRVTSGGFGPSVEAPVAMGYVAAAHAAPGTALMGDVRGKRLPVTVSDLPFRPSTYKR
ncbi:glycine cleavage system aminomethyltransferase GcvT [Cereibacter sphaeroides]|uniref:glycine cleavage system aminomethyltransferase GcvT n=1 Tax=Rhodobacterales TaxID=204455 RepID=UPI000BBF3673|nr:MULTISPECIES: glycine cleavage system aminomethyltransferase GcvT [Paracoccaceae]MCE6961284.1 glycine cleavage system aminomethyltransferase GcvT [Cereibacter sphaeroides]MCE6970270.1 glycine cleavage system aminomethyltransferase GcvT [Cereibacter sphaeroides]MCE6973991.1 glycine cleavage system aminomethyltransferase GcvT [Cereibacter sphaeroides]